MSVQQPPVDDAFGRDANNRPGLGGFLADGTGLTLEMSRGSVTGYGYPLFAPAPGVPAPPPGPFASISMGLKVAPTIAPGRIAAATTSLDTFSFLNDDGAMPMANTDVIWVSKTAAFTLPNTVGDAVPIRPGGAMDVQDANLYEWFCMSLTAGQVLRYLGAAS